MNEGQIFWKIDHMKSSSKSLTMVSVLFVVSAGGCVLIGYDLTGYGPAPDAGGGGAGTGGGGSDGSSAGGGGAGPSSGSTSSDTSSSSSSGISCPLCDDNDLCTKDICMNGKCTNKPLIVPDEGNACTEDICDKSTGMPSHKLIPGCCAHSACVSGNGPLDPASCNPTMTDTCVDAVCKVKKECCSFRWDQPCVDQAKVSCSALIENVNVFFSCKCNHSYCDIGAPLEPGCDPCVNEICKKKPECCALPPAGTWTKDCVDATYMYCGIPIGKCQ